GPRGAECLETLAALPDTAEVASTDVLKEKPLLEFHQRSRRPARGLEHVITPENAERQAVKGGRVDVRCPGGLNLGQRALEVRRGRSGEGADQHSGRLDALLEQALNALHHREGLARAGAGQYAQRRVGRRRDAKCAPFKSVVPWHQLPSSALRISRESIT